MSADVSNISPSSDKVDQGTVGSGAGGSMVTREPAKINYLNEKHLLIPWGLRMLIWKMHFCSDEEPLLKMPALKSLLGGQITFS